jgi:antitoxin component YwqK of YwqJK toxin-antitoxin module
MRNRIVFLLLFLSILPGCFAQTDTIFNQTDSQGLKQGYWKKFYPNGNKMYVGYFKNNKPAGELHRYYETGKIQAIMNFSADGVSSRVSLFYDNGGLSATGKYFQTLKDSTWNYYSYYTGKLVSEEHYTKGMKTGIQKTFYENGKPSEETEYQNDMKQGIWNQYFDDGTLKMKTSNNFNMVNGRYTFYYPNNVMQMVGTFVDNKRNGLWIFYTDDGKEKYRITYQMGKINSRDEQKLIDQDKEFFNQVDANIGKFEDPSVEDFYKGPF